PCLSPTACGTNAQCSVQHHEKQCLCPKPLQGDPNIACRPETRMCATKRDCPSGSTCTDGVCLASFQIRACEGVRCGPNADCVTSDHTSSCLCRNGYEGNPSDLTICEDRLCVPGCRTDSVCADNQACVNKQCTVAESCSTRNPCGDQALCTDLGGGGVSCTCPPGCTGDPHQACVCTGLPPGCQCGQNANCTVQGGRQECVCPIEYPLGDPYVQCFAGRNTEDCRVTGCGRGALCTRDEEGYSCHCPSGTSGSPSLECKPDE
ncbi:neurogenic locus notch homolog protein 1-like, partial [Diaphorina citri]|uniref:Neurogenic locus notch homolog protein 1-like n=1 Tax=Diaphorina citri TaxID=121845 RepID=A0A3Q0J9E2_DIACI